LPFIFRVVTPLLWEAWREEACVGERERGALTVGEVVAIGEVVGEVRHVVEGVEAGQGSPRARGH
jgi:hypothetical protein